VLRREAASFTPAEARRLLRAPQILGLWCNGSFADPNDFCKRALACHTPASPLGLLAASAADNCESAQQRLEVGTTLYLLSYLSTTRYDTARNDLRNDLATDELDCRPVAGAVLQALVHAAALGPRDFERENATLGASRLLGLLTVTRGVHSRFDAKNTMLHEVLQHELGPLREESAATALMALLTELMETQRSAEFASQSDAWLEAGAQLEALHRRPFGSYPQGPFSLLAIALALHNIGRTALAAGCTLRGASTPDEALPALAARLLKLVSDAVRRRGLLLHQLAHVEERAAELRKTQALIDEAMLRDPSLLAADQRTLAQANLENPEHWHTNARYTQHRTSCRHPHPHPLCTPGP
jgi:hypothetical protein